MNHLSEKEMLAMARNLLQSSAALHEEALPGDGEGVYVCEMIMGGRGLMVAPDASVLFADSSMSFDEQLEAFRRGVRTPLGTRENDKA